MGNVDCPNCEFELIFEPSKKGDCRRCPRCNYHEDDFRCDWRPGRPIKRRGKDENS